MKKFVTALILMFCMIFGWYCFAGEITGSNIEDSMTTLQIYTYDTSEYPYVVIGKVVADELDSSVALRVLKKRAVSIGADAVLHYRNRKGPFGYKAEGIAVRWKRGEVN